MCSRPALLALFAVFRAPKVDSTAAEGRVIADAEYFVEHLQDNEGPSEVMGDSLLQLGLS